MSSVKETTEIITGQVAVKAAEMGASNSEAYEVITSNIITLMGLSFILGVFFTTFLLLVLEFVRRNRGEH